MKELSDYIYHRITIEDYASLPSGLKGGRMGICLFLALYLKKKKGKKGRKMLSAILTDAIKELPNLPCSLLNGAMGTGWAIQYLSVNEILSFKDEISKLYTLIINYYMGYCASAPLQFIKEDQLFSIGIYILQLRTEDDSITHYTVNEILIGLIDECERLMKWNIKDLYSSQDISLSMLHSILLFLLRMNETGIYPVQTSRLIGCITEFHRHIHKQNPSDDYIYHFLLHGSANFPEMKEDELFHFMGEIGFYSLLYESPQLFCSAYAQYNDKYPVHKKNIKIEINKKDADIATLCGWGYGLLNL